jgi:hypothetical protein
MIVEFDRTQIEELKRRVANVTKGKYIMYLTENNTIVIRPTVNARELETFVLVRIGTQDIEHLTKWWGDYYKVKSVSFKEDILI